MKNKFLFILLVLLLLPIALCSQNRTIQGNVVDEFKEPLAGATIRVKNGNKAAATDHEGRYSIDIKEKDILIFSFLGFRDIEKTVGSENNISVQMEPISQETEEVVIVGYGKQRKLDMTGSIATISAEDISRLPVANALEALSGKVSGVEVIGNAEPGESPTIRIRGVGSYGETAPICVIDGQFFEISELSSVSPSDIESLSILKDASATAIYGSRGANGVIIVTTKQGSGEKGKIRVTANVYMSVSEVGRLLPTANESQWQQIENLSFLADNWNDPSAKDRLPYPDWAGAGKGADWQTNYT